MRVMHVISGLGTGGAESFLATLAPRLTDAGIEQFVVSLSGGGPIATKLEAAGVPLSLIDLRKGVLQGTRALAREIDTFKPDAIQGWMYHGDLFATLARSLRRGAKSKLYWGVRCSDMRLSDYPLQLRLTVRACAALSRIPDAVIVNSQAGARVHRGMGYRPRAWNVFRNGIDPERFRPDPISRAQVRSELGIGKEEIVAISVARVDPMKDHATLLAALAQVSNLRTVLVGLGTDALANTPNVLGLGRRADVARLLCAGDIVISSSAYGEGFSNAVAEGMSVGLIPVATDVGDAADLIGDVGFLTPPGNADALGKALRDARDRVKGGGNGLAARARILENFDLSDVVDRFAALYTAQPGG